MYTQNMALSFDTYEAPAHGKRRYKVYNMSFHVDENTEKRSERKKNIYTAEKAKPYKRRAIARDRRFKYDECRGEEEPVDMWEEELNARLSEREAKPFTIVYTWTDKFYIETYDRRGDTRIVLQTRTRSGVVSRGTVYKGRKNEKDITVVHEIHDYKVRRVLECDFVIAEKALFETVQGSGELKTCF